MNTNPCPLVGEANLSVPIAGYRRQSLLAQFNFASDKIQLLRAADKRLQLELELGVVARLLAAYADFSAQLHRQGAHQDALAVGVWNGHYVVLAAR